MIREYSDEYTELKYDSYNHSYNIILDGHKYIWRVRDTQIQLYDNKWIDYSNLISLLRRFLAMHHDKIYYVEYDVPTADSTLEVILNNKVTVLKNRNIEVEIIFDTEKLEESIKVNITENDNLHTHNYKRLNNYYTYKVLMNEKEVLNNIKADLKIE